MDIRNKVAHELVTRVAYHKHYSVDVRFILWTQLEGSVNRQVWNCVGVPVLGRPGV